MAPVFSTGNLFIFMWCDDVVIIFKLNKHSILRLANCQ